MQGLRELKEEYGRVVTEYVCPEISGGRFPIKRVRGEEVAVEADIYTHGHDAVECELLFRHGSERYWSSIGMTPLSNDRWRGSFTVQELGIYFYTVRGWIDPFETWRRSLHKRLGAGEDVSVDLLIGAELVKEASSRASGDDSSRLLEASSILMDPGVPTVRRTSMALDGGLRETMARYPDKSRATLYPVELRVVVDRERARFSTWYEMFARSCAGEHGRHGTLSDCIARLPYIAGMGFDVLYLPPVHPIGRTNRKGRDNSPNPGPEEPGSPWAIGSEEGGHKAIHPQLGTLEDFRELVGAARRYGMEIAMDLAFQCSPDHPYVMQHPEWFRVLPDGAVQCAENPPKRYEDIYPLDFESEHRQSLWQELKSIVDFWIVQGIRIFRVDNPHTKPFAFWEWLIHEVKTDHPEVIFLSEAFTRPKVMYRLAKLGFTQSYTYFAWRNNKWGLIRYFQELTCTDAREYFRPHLWPNTPDILTEYLQMGGRPAFIIRLILAATLGASYGIYGPAFELCENTPKEEGGEEYLHSEKYEIRNWHLEKPDSLREIIARVNRIRRENPALQTDSGLFFHTIHNEHLICYSKRSPDRSNILVMVVNLDPHHTQSGWLELSLDELGLDPERPFQVHDLLSDSRFLWQGPSNYIELDPRFCPAHVFLIRRRVRTELDFDYFM
jgi:starch synthase (maltosyl-transferring)